MSEVKVERERGFVARAKALLNIGEDGHLGSFDAQVKKFFSTQIADNQHNRTALITEHKKTVGNINDLIEDATVDLETAWATIDPECIKRREDQKAHISKYLENIEYAESRLEGLQDQLAEIIKSHKSDLKDLDDTIAELTKKLDKFTNL